ncbi:MAG: DUF3426 domain-containing protein [Gammaproteobacteria bacterium]
MFSLCPHCQFLLARDPRSGRLPADCPNCGGGIVDEDPPPVPAPTPTAASAPTGADPAGEAQAQAPAQHARRPRRRRGEDAAAAAAAAADAAPPPQVPPAASAAPASPPPAAVRGSPGAAGARTTAPGAADESVHGIDRPPAAAADSTANSTAVSTADAAPESGIEPDTGPGIGRAGQADHSEHADAPAPATPVDSADTAEAAPPPAPARARGRRLPSFLQARNPARRARGRAPAVLWTAIGLLALALALQLLLADRARLALDPDWRPVLARLCGAFGCTLPPWREPQAFTMLSRDVRAHPQRPGTLRVSASFRNDAAWPQPWPVLLLTLSDLDGRVAGARAFVPDDYLEVAERGRLLAPGQVATVTLDVVEPAPGIVAFTFDFR